MSVIVQDKFNYEEIAKLIDEKDKKDSEYWSEFRSRLESFLDKEGFRLGSWSVKYPPDKSRCVDVFIKHKSDKGDYYGYE